MHKSKLIWTTVLFLEKLLKVMIVSFYTPIFWETVGSSDNHGNHLLHALLLTGHIIMWAFLSNSPFVSLVHLMHLLGGGGGGLKIGHCVKLCSGHIFSHYKAEDHQTRSVDASLGGEGGHEPKIGHWHHFGMTSCLDHIFEREKNKKRWRTALSVGKRAMLQHF